MNILAVIPARGGSKGIPRKNVRLMNGKPLITYALENAKTCDLIDDIVVTTDDEEIIGITKLNSVDYIERRADLAGDNITLDPVVYEAVQQMEKRKSINYDVIITLQPTSPLLRTNTLKNAIESFLASNQDTYISVVNRPHLSWHATTKGYSPNYLNRLNRQQLPPNYIETGAFFITKRECIKINSRIGENLSVFEIPSDEAVDIDDVNDWNICENILKKKRIVFRADGHKLLGMGHIYHCLTLAYNLTGHEIIFATREDCVDGIKKISASHMQYKLMRDDADFFEFLKEWKPDIIVNDCLDTNKQYIKKLKTLSPRVVTIEDLGEGAEYADAVINALYCKFLNKKNQYSGENYICLRDEFLTNMPKEFSDKVHNVLVIFGGTDPSNLTKKIYSLATSLHKDYPDIVFNFIIGSGYEGNKNGIITRKNDNIYVYRDVRYISEYMKKADLAFTSQGRTVFELATLGVPSIVLAQNEREKLHTFAQMQNGFLNLGLGEKISDETLRSTFKWLEETTQIIKEMRSLMLNHDLNSGVHRVINVILGVNEKNE